MRLIYDYGEYYNAGYAYDRIIYSYPRVKTLNLL